MLCLGGRVIGTELAAKLVEAFITAQPSEELRHLRRVGKVRSIEENEMKG
jgi:ribose 5-phosphate isomerase B